MAKYKVQIPNTTASPSQHTMSNVALIISASTTSTKTLQQYLDKEVSAFKRSAWVGSLFLDNVTVVDDDMFLDKVTVVDDDMKDGSISDDVSHESITRNTEDICRYLPGGPNHNHAVNCFIRLDPEIFPPSEKQEAAFEAKNLTYIKLRGELQRAAIQCGYSIVPKSNARFVCKCARTYSNSISSSKQKRQAEIDEIDEEENDKENNDPQSSYRDKANVPPRYDLGVNINDEPHASSSMCGFPARQSNDHQIEVQGVPCRRNFFLYWFSCNS